jgi:[amino group carrier protein]-L-2-aminoadipate 6-kinase
MASAFSDSAIKDLGDASRTNETVIVHGGGDTVTRVAEQLNLPQKFVVSPEGFKSRLTDKETIEVYTMVMAGKINKKIVRDLQRIGIAAVGLSGLDAGTIQASRKTRIVAKDSNGRRRVVEGGYTGSITSIKEHLIQTILAERYLPVVAPIALGTEYEPLNVDGDRAAAQIAGALRANLLVLLTDVEHVLLDGKPVRRWTAEEARRQVPFIGPGMNTKVQAAIDALSLGVDRAVIAPAMGDAPYSSAIAGETGTEISA